MKTPVTVRIRDLGQFRSISRDEFVGRAEALKLMEENTMIQATA